MNQRTGTTEDPDITSTRNSEYTTLSYTGLAAAQTYSEKSFIPLGE
jgi:hypothetical protein